MIRDRAVTLTKKEKKEKFSSKQGLWLFLFKGFSKKFQMCFCREVFGVTKHLKLPLPSSISLFPVSRSWSHVWMTPARWPWPGEHALHISCSGFNMPQGPVRSSCYPAVSLQGAGSKGPVRTNELRGS